jgi:hypothetical protein
LAETTKKTTRKTAKTSGAKSGKSRRSASVIFDSITLEGGLLSSAMLARIAARGAGHQSEADYGVPKGLTLRDEIARYFRIGAALFKDFTASSAPSLTATIAFTEGLLSQVLGFNEPRTNSNAAAGVAFSTKQGRVPVVVVPPSDDLDRASALLSSEGRRRSAASTLQDWLNQTDHALWGFCTNGDRLRLMRDNASLTRPAFIEVNLRQIFESENFADFAAAWQIFHSSRFGLPSTPATECILEAWRADGAKEGVTARDRLRDGVEAALLVLGNGFLAHPENAALRNRVVNGELPVSEYFGQLLRLVYRLIFMLVAEDRGLLHPPNSAPSAAKLYSEGYSVSALRTRAIRRTAWDQHFDRWEGLLITFAGLANGQPKLALPALGGLFEDTVIPDLERARLANRALMEAIYRLAWLKDEASLVPVNWRDMETEELGSVYESLLELTPILVDQGRGLTFAEGNETKGNQRKTTGSYYTPDSLVQTLLDSALDPVIDRVEAESNDKIRGLLGITVIDPACGSGHFLLAAARRIAARVARARTSGVASTQDYRHALRDVVRSCIHGVDRNPMAVELTKVALWIETVEPGKPLGFLDASILCGDSLLGVFDLEVLREGIPDAAYKPLSGDDKDAAKYFDRRNKAERDGQGTLDFAGGKSTLPAAPPLAASLRAVRNLPEDTTGEIAEKRKRLAAAKSERQLWGWRMAADLQMAAFLMPKKDVPREPGAALVPTTDHVWRTLSGGQVYGPLVGTACEVVNRARVFHWPLEFPDVMAVGGFDVVVGNPPWERIKLQEQEFFAAREPEIASAPTADARGKLIAQLKAAHEGTREHRLYNEFELAKRAAGASSIFAREGGRFPLTGRGDVNTYALFSELFSVLTNRRGRSGVIVPTGVATDGTTAEFFASLLTSFRLVSLIDFENRERLFPTIDSRMKFCILTLGHEQDAPVFSFFLANTAQLAEAERSFKMSYSEMARINPNTKTAPVFRSRADADLTTRIYSRVPVLFDASDSALGNPWSFEYMTKMFDMADNSGEFKTATQCTTEGFSRSGNGWFDTKGQSWVPVYEAKMIHTFDHRWATCDGRDFRDSLVSEKASGDFEAMPRFWLPAARVRERLVTKNWGREWLMGWRDITNTTNERTVISTAYPAVAVGHTLRNMFVGTEPILSAAFLACLSSLPFDYLARQKLGGTHLTVEILQQLPVIPPASYKSADLAYISSIVLELCYTSQSMRGFARDLGYDGPLFHWNEDRRAILRAELDAWYARAYGLTRDELRYILDPADVMGPDYPSETFRVLKNNEIKRFGEYRTRRLVLEAWDRLETSARRSATTTTSSPRPAAIDPSSLADGAWAASTGSADAATAQLAALIKALPGPTPITHIRLAALFALEPRYLTRRLSGSERATWLRLVGSAAHLPEGGNIVSFAPRINANWQRAVTQLRGMGAILEDTAAWTWAPGPPVHEFFTEAWPDGRAAFVLRILGSLNLADVTSGLPVEDRSWVEAYAA